MNEENCCAYTGSEIPEPKYWDTSFLVTVPVSRFEELTKKECLLHQIENALTLVDEYKLKNAIQLLLSVLPK